MWLKCALTTTTPYHKELCSTQRSGYFRLISVTSALSGLFKKIFKHNPNMFQEFFRASLEWIKTLPQFYQIHEMTSLTGGTFNPGLELTFEKQLLTMVT